MKSGNAYGCRVVIVNAGRPMPTAREETIKLETRLNGRRRAHAPSERDEQTVREDQSLSALLSNK